VFAPYFPPDQPHKFANVHKIFGASNITKLLNELPQHQREDAVNSLAYEADARVKDPVYGCVGAISLLQRQVAQLQNELAIAHSDLAGYAGARMVIGGPASGSQAHGGAAAAGGPSSSSASLGIGMGLPGTAQSGGREQHQMLTRQQLIGLARDQPPQQLTREQIMELARVGGGLSGALTAGPLGSGQYSSSRTTGGESHGSGSHGDRTAGLGHMQQSRGS
jgi:hypothetical protein